MLRKEIDTRRTLDIMKTLSPEMQNRLLNFIEDAVLFAALRDGCNAACAATQPTTASP